MNHQITWVSIPTKDFDRAVNFYSTLTGETFKVQGEGDNKMATSVPDEEWEKGVVGFGVSADSTITPGQSGVRIYLAAPDMDGFLGRVEGAGGKILTSKTAMGSLGFWALIEDTEGNHIGFHSMK